MNEAIWFLILGTAYLMLFGIAEWLLRKFKWQAEHTRKLVHVFSGILALVFPLVFENHWWVLTLCFSFYLILIISRKYKWLQSINGVDRTTYGSDLFPVAVYFLFLFYRFHLTRNIEHPELERVNPLYLYYHPLLILALCDPTAALAGRKWPLGKLLIFGHKKTILGSTAFVMMALLISGLLFYSFQGSYHAAAIYFFTVAILTAIAEMVSTKGVDNFVIVAVAAFTDYLFLIR